MKVIRTTTQNFNTIANQRAETAKEYFTSENFINGLRYSIRSDMIEKGRDFSSFSIETYNVGTPFDPQRDMPHIQTAFSKLKAEYPELNHVRLDAKRGYIILDTQPNTFFRRRTARGPSSGW